MGFHEVSFPLRLALGTRGGPVRRTDIVNLSNGREARNQRWRDSRRAYDAGSGVRSAADLYALVAFFEARAGALNGFRFRDPLDWCSAGPDGQISALDQVIGTGDGAMLGFPLIKTYGDGAARFRRSIAKPVAGSLLLAVAGQPVAPGSATLDATTGLVSFAAGKAPPAGAVVTAGFRFDVPVRFATDRLEFSLEAFQAGRVPTIPLLEITP